MRVAIFQLLMIQDVIKVEYKITTADGFSKLIEKMIETESDYEQFKKDVRLGVASLDDIIKKQLKINNNGLSANNDSNEQPTEHQSAAV